MYEAKSFDNISGIKGLSDNLLKNHLTLYQGYVNNFNKLDSMLMAMEKAGALGTPEYAELNRRFGWEFNGMRLHELYFGNLSRKPSALDSKGKLMKLLVDEWGSYELFEKDLKEMGKIRGIGWVVLYYDQESERLFNVWINEHDAGHFAGCVPLLVMDVFEHAYMPDYGLKKADYIEVFMKAVDWKVVSKRLG